MDKINDTRNFSLPMNDSRPSDICDMPFAQGTTFVVIIFLLSIFGTCGNLLIVFSVLKTPELRQRASYILIQSLAVADLLVTMIAQPILTISMALRTFSHRCIRELDITYIIVYTFSGLCSNFHLVSISIDRAISVLKPHQHRTIMKKALRVMLCVSWGTAILFGSLYVPVPEINYAIMASNLGSTLVMICAYASFLYKIIFSKMNSVGPVVVASSTAREKAMEKRISVTLAIVIFMYTTCWVPVFVYYATHPKRTTIDVTFWWIRIIYLANSSMNFIIYSSRIQRFRTAYLKIINGVFQTLREAVRKCCFLN